MAKLKFLLYYLKGGKNSDNYNGINFLCTRLKLVIKIITKCLMYI